VSEPKRYDVTESFGLGDMIESSYGNWVRWEAYEELKLENSQYEEHHKYGQNVITSLREDVERLTKAGDAMANNIPRMVTCQVTAHEAVNFMNDWNAAKEGNGQP